ncbi:unnamed protein product [Oncorhynchus mykiss]|uniref:protein-tyrosine-phosphatase n=1 Tax=Oncorhynchus mykiss TaxID=8022 RepID=A0A060XQN2_ONCMY|nr:unnamed protein product [Oncorhynchus mykiss]
MVPVRSGRYVSSSSQRGLTTVSPSTPPPSWLSYAESRPVTPLTQAPSSPIAAIHYEIIHQIDMSAFLRCFSDRLWLSSITSHSSLLLCSLPSLALLPSLLLSLPLSILLTLVPYDIHSYLPLPLSLLPSLLSPLPPTPLPPSTCPSPSLPPSLSSHPSSLIPPPLPLAIPPFIPPPNPPTLPPLQRLANSKAHTSRFISANLPCNKFKNRLVNIMPYETTRVCLQPIRGLEGSDYINSSFIDGYRQQKAYIATQGPLAETTEDFWRMLWENNSTIVVMLTKLREMGREKCHQYWPAERSARYQYFVVDPMAEYNMPQYILREFKVTDARDGQSRTVRQFQFTDWPEQGVPKSGEGFIDFIGQVHKTKEQFGQDGPISVHCSAGVGRTGVFITLSIVLERMRYEGVVDIFQTVKMLRTQRPAMVQTEDEYQFSYQAGLEYLGSFDHYATSPFVPPFNFVFLFRHNMIIPLLDINYDPEYNTCK